MSNPPAGINSLQGDFLFLALYAFIIKSLCGVVIVKNINI